MVQSIDKIIEGDHETVLGMTIEKIIIENKDIDIEVEVGTIIGIFIEKVIGMAICKAEILMEIGVE